MTLKGQTRDPNTLRAQYLENYLSYRDFKFGMHPLGTNRFVSGVPSGRTNNYPESGRGLGHVSYTIFGIRSNISLKLLELETSNLIHGFVWAMPSRRVNNFPESRRALGHVTLTIFGSTVGYPSDSLASCLADCTNGRAYATLLRVWFVALCTVAKRCIPEQVTIDSL